MALERPIKLPSGIGMRSIAGIAAVTILVTLAFMQIRDPAPPSSGNYQSPPWAIAIHLGTVIPSLVLGPVILTRRKGGAAHRRLGLIWMGMMVTTAATSFWIRSESGSFSGIHLFSIGTLIAIPMAIWRARVRDIRAHQQIMTSLYVGLIVAGAFALEPNRVAGQFVWRFLSGG